MAQSERSQGELELLGRLIHALERADDALRSGVVEESEIALSEGLAVLGTLYGTLDATGSPEAAAHLGAAYDACLRGLGEAFGGSHEALLRATVLLRSVQTALVPRPAAPRKAA